MNQMRITKQGLLRSQSGSVMILVAFAIPVLIAAIGLATDFSKLEGSKTRFVNAVDQAVLAAASSGAVDATNYAGEYIRANVQNHDITLDTVSVTVDASRTSWEITATGTAQAQFSQIFGKKSFALSHTAKAVWDNGKVTEIVAMVDVSGTMCAQFQRSQNAGSVAIDFVPDSTCTKLAMMKKALSEIANTGVSYVAGEQPAYKVGIVPFTYKVKLPNPQNMPSFMTQAENAAGIDPNYFTNVSDAEMDGGPLPAVVPLMPIQSEADKTSLLTKIDAITSGNGQEFQRAAWKRSALGAQISALMLDPRYHSVFGGATPEDFTATNKVNKIVIMMTDSANLGCCFTNYPSTNFRNHYIYSYADDHQQLVGTGGSAGICRQMKNAGIEIYTVLLDVDRNDMDTRGAEIVDSFQQCATDTAHSFEVKLNDNDTLKDAYQTIGRAIMKVRLYK